VFHPVPKHIYFEWNQLIGAATGDHVMTHIKHKIICAPEPRHLNLIFSSDKLAFLRNTYDLIEIQADALNQMDHRELHDVRYIIGQPPISDQTLGALSSLKAIFNVESNLINNMSYATLFERGIHVLTTGAVFAQPVAEIALGFALDLARGISGNNADFATNSELWGGDGNRSARLLNGSQVGIIGFGDLGRSLRTVLSGFGCKIKVFDPWMAPSIIHKHDVQPAGLDEVLQNSDFIFVMAAVTSENKKFLGADAFAKMRKSAHFILMSRADVVDFDAMLNAVSDGHITVATDVWPQEPLPIGHRARTMPGILKSAHRAGAMDQVFQGMGDMVLEDLALLDRDLPPQCCKRAERETAAKFQSKPVDKN
jgi:phosphoglycerate dehydrogenase-like enzyme